MTDWTFDPTDTLSMTDALVSTITIPVIDSFHIQQQAYTRDVTISSSMVEAELQNFPVLISLTDASLKSVSNGGHVSNVNGYDILFYLNGEKLSHEIDTYDATTGSYVAWVRIPVLIETGDTVLKMEYGDSASVNPSTTAVWDANYVAVYHMNDVTTSTIKDSTSNGNNGTKEAANTPIQIDGKIGKGQEFDETHTEYINCGTNVKLGTTSPYTIQTWLKFTDDINNDSFLMGKSGNHWGFMYSAVSGAKRLYFDTYTDASVYKTAYTNAVVSNTWYMLTGVYASNGYNNIYLNGSYVRNVNVGTNLNYNTVTLYLGRVSTLYMDGSLDEIHISKIARSADWIKTEYNNQNSPSSYLTLGAETCSILADYGMIYADTLTMSDSEVQDFSSITSDSFPIIDTLVDSLKVEFIAAISDTFSISDSFLAGVGAVISDTMVFSDSYIKGVSSVTSDILTISDSHTKGVTMPLTDSFSISDIVTKGVGIPISDTLLMHEAITKGVGVVVTDSFSIIDSFVKNELRKLIMKSKFKQGKKYTSTSES